jgi:elongation factor G
MAFKQAMAEASPVLLEPIVRITIAVPEDCVGEVIGDLNSRRGHPLGMEPKGGSGSTEIVAEVPMADVLDYAPALRAVTGGRGEYTLEFDRHEEVPAHLAEQVIADARSSGSQTLA